MVLDSNNTVGIQHRPIYNDTEPYSLTMVFNSDQQRAVFTTASETTAPIHRFFSGTSLTGVKQSQILRSLTTKGLI